MDCMSCRARRPEPSQVTAYIPLATRAWVIQLVEMDGNSAMRAAGMAVNLELKIGKRRVIEYFLSPLFQRGSESLRER